MSHLHDVRVWAETAERHNSVRRLACLVGAVMFAITACGAGTEVVETAGDAEASRQALSECDLHNSIALLDWLGNSSAWTRIDDSGFRFQNQAPRGSTELQNAKHLRRPIAISLAPGNHPLRGEMPRRSVLEEDQLERVQAALASGKAVLAGHSRSTVRAISVGSQGEVEFLDGQCLDLLYSSELDEFAAWLDTEAADRHSTDQAILEELIKSPEGQLAMEYRRWREGPPAPRWDDLEEQARPVDPALTPDAVMEELRSVQMLVSVDGKIVDGSEWAICAKSGPGWSGCVSAAALSPETPYPRPVYVPAATEEQVEIWLFKDEPDYLLNPIAHLGSVTVSQEPSVIHLQISTTRLATIAESADRVEVSSARVWVESQAPTEPES